MEEIIEEYGELMMGVFFGFLVLSIAGTLVFSQGLLEKFILLFGNTAC